ncbi:MAG: hypothetical protein A2Y10_07600 [Planctomycetes bacterium GWF2_41_51]|nr:MAG: hypothetical protein A2Y10_07600 [Planctomycetes bacterium GWF2_41_51]HBG26872.1 hypothetical protein [Phycisphaerales bacterium]
MAKQFSNVITAILLICVSSAAALDLQPGAFDAAGIYKLAAIDPNLTGKGVNVALVCRSDTYIDSVPQNDYRPDISLRCFQKSNASFHDDLLGIAGISKHTTEIASILTGVDANAFHPEVGEFSYTSVVPNAHLNVYEFWYFVTDYIFTGQWPKDDVLTMSLGWSSESWWSRGIDGMVEDYGFLVVAAIGNGTEAYDLPLYPAAGANVLAVGVADSNDTLYDFGAPDSNHSTAGPTLDGRCKPDIIAPGNCLVASSDNTYKASGDYSSFAAPIVTGVASMLIQKAKSDPNLQIAVSGFSGNCVMKSILMTSAKKLSDWQKGFANSEDDYEYPLDFKQGAGMIDAVSAYNLLIAGLQRDGDVNTTGWDLNMVEPDNTVEKIYSFQTADNQKTLTATLVWNRVYEHRYPFNLDLNLWKDLQLVLRRIDSNGQMIVTDVSDSPVDNVEHIYVPVEPNSVYELVVSNSPNVQSKGTATYAVSWQIQ